MKCINCLSHNAGVRRPRGAEWLFTIWAWPIYCNRCMSRFYGPTLVVIPLYWFEQRRLRRELARANPTPAVFPEVSVASASTGSLPEATNLKDDC